MSEAMQLFWHIFGSSEPKMAKIKAEPKNKRLALVQANIQLGIDLIALRNISASDRDFGRIVRTRYEIDQPHALACMRVARLYADNGDKIIARLSWRALAALASVATYRRQALERRILAGERIGAAEIRGRTIHTTPHTAASHGD